LDEGIFPGDRNLVKSMLCGAIAPDVNDVRSSFDNLDVIPKTSPMPIDFADIVVDQINKYSPIRGRNNLDNSSLDAHRDIK
jgi:hypothetical protein